MYNNRLCAIHILINKNTEYAWIITCIIRESRVPCPHYVVPWLYYVYHACIPCTMLVLRCTVSVVSWLHYVVPCLYPVYHICSTCTMHELRCTMPVLRCNMPVVYVPYLYYVYRTCMTCTMPIWRVSCPKYVQVMMKRTIFNSRTPCT